MSTYVSGYDESHYSTQYYLNNAGNDTKVGQSFLWVGNGMRLSYSSFWLWKQYSPTGPITSKLYAHTGSYGTTGVPTGSPLATSTNSIDASTLSSSTVNWFNFTFDKTFAPTEGTPYVITCEYNSGYHVKVCAGGNPWDGHGGNISRYSGSWGANALDLMFTVYSDPPPTYIKTIYGLARGSVKTVKGLPIASMKTHSGLS